MERDTGLKSDAVLPSADGLICLEAVSASMQAVQVMMRELAQSEVPVLVSGEAGSGKRTIGRRIHAQSRRHAEPFRPVGCASLGADAFAIDSPSPLLAYGTVFLEDIAELSSERQTELLDLLSSKERENGNSRLQARLMCGTCSDLEGEVRSGKFREDLYYRISCVSLHLPPLRQRKEDIGPLTSFFLSKYAQEYQRAIPALSPETRQLFHDYAWPGNVRELEDAAKTIVLLGDETLAMGGLRTLLARPDRSGSGERVSLKQAARAASREAEKELILKVLNKTRWNRRRAAQELQISYKALLYKLKQIGYGEYGTT
jgi:two-component system response regulator AtoC